MLEWDREPGLWPLTLHTHGLLHCRQVLFVCTGYQQVCYAGFDDIDDGDVGRQLAPIIIYTHRHEKQSCHTFSSTAPSSIHPLSRNEGYPIASCHFSDGKWCFDAASPPIADAFQTSWSLLKCLVSVDVGVGIKSTPLHWLILIILWAAVHGRPWRSTSHHSVLNHMFCSIINPRHSSNSQFTDQKHHKSTQNKMG